MPLDPDDLLRRAPEAWRRAVLATAGATRRLVAAVGRARAAHPALALAPDAFVAHVARHLPADGDLAAALETLHAADLYLCRATLDGDATALAAFEARLARAAGAVLGRAGVAAAERDVLTQRVRVRLLVAEDRGEPKLALYAGRGPLGPWLRASAWRAMLLARRRERPEVLLGEDDWLAWPAMADDPEIERLRRDFREGFKRAATEALEALDPKAKLLLRQHLLDGVPVNRLAPVYGVHVATIYRRLEEARAALVRDVRRRLAGSLRLETGDVERLLGLFESQLDVSVRRLLGPG